MILILQKKCMIECFKSKRWELTSVEFIFIVDLDNMGLLLSKELFLLPDNVLRLEGNMVMKWAFSTLEEDFHQGNSLKKLSMPWKSLRRILWDIKFSLNQEDTLAQTHFTYWLKFWVRDLRMVKLVIIWMNPFITASTVT